MGRRVWGPVPQKRALSNWGKITEILTTLSLDRSHETCFELSEDVFGFPPVQLVPEVIDQDRV